MSLGDPTCAPAPRPGGHVPHAVRGADPPYPVAGFTASGGAHTWHAVAPGFAVYDPMAVHSVHAVAPGFALKYPGAQEVQIDAPCVLL